MDQASSIGAPGFEPGTFPSNTCSSPVRAPCPPASRGFPCHVLASRPRKFTAPSPLRPPSAGSTLLAGVITAILLAVFVDPAGLRNAREHSRETDMGKWSRGSNIFGTGKARSRPLVSWGSHGWRQDVAPRDVAHRYDVHAGGVRCGCARTTDSGPDSEHRGGGTHRIRQPEQRRGQ